VGFSTKTSSSKAGKGMLGYSPIPQHLLEKSAQAIVDWLNYNVLTNFVNLFPQDIIETDGAQIYEVVSFLAGKNNLPRAKPESL
jgi:hypothetical protein